MHQQHEAMGSPFLRVPIEILRDIMQYVVPTHGNIDGPNSPSTAPFVIASVCSLWRKLALSTPELWVVIICHDSRHCLPRTKLLLSRSRDRTLGLFIGFIQPRSRCSLVEIIQPHFYRAGYLSTNYGLINTLNSGPIFPRLRFFGSEWKWRTPDILDVFRYCPHLEDVRIFISDDQTHARTFQGVTMNQLQRMRLSFDTDPSEFFNRLTIPNLLEFKIGEGDKNIPWIQPFTRVLQRSKASLRELYSYYSSIDPYALREIFSVSPNLETLGLDSNGHVTSHILADLAITLQHSILLPKLKIFHQYPLHARDMLSPQELYAMMLSRSRAECPLTKVLIEFDDLLQDMSSSPLNTASFRMLWKDAHRMGCALEVFHEVERPVRFDTEGHVLNDT